MAFWFRTVSAVSLAGAYLLSSGRIPQCPEFGFLSAFAAIWTAHFLVFVVWNVILYPKVFSPLRGLPEPSGNSWFMGQFAKIYANSSGVPHMGWYEVFPTGTLQHLASLLTVCRINSVPNDGVIRYLGPFNLERLFITSPKALAEVLVTKNYDFSKPYQFRFTIGRLLGIGVLLAEGDEHKVQRRNLLPAFAFRHIKDLYPVFWDKAREGVEAMTREILGDASKAASEDKKTAVIEVGNWASRITLDIIGVAGLGRDFGAIANPDNELNQTYQHVFKPNRQAAILGLLQVVIPPWFLNLLPLKRNSDVEQAAKKIRATCADLIREKKQKLAQNELVDVDILSVALESGGFTDENLVDQLMTFLAAGHETTASAMTWAVYLLARHPEVQERLRAEVRERLPPISSGEDGSTVSSLDIDHMPYLNAVCNEVLRYFSPAPITLRSTVCDTSIQGHFVPKGTQIMIVPWAINKSKSMWGEDALQFNPDRWLPKSDGDKRAASGGATSNYAFMTFLHGPRSCIGQAFAKAEFACLVASWVGRFHMELHNMEEMDEEKLEIKSTVTARPAKG
ncbi:Cytochrome P450 734A6 [Madurella mycetomatis]|nr:Cytochrome P450 734A6 [Madurella mycetomatis]